MERRNCHLWEDEYNDKPEKRKKEKKLQSLKEERFWQEDAEALEAEDWDEEKIWDTNRFNGYSGCINHRR